MRQLYSAVLYLMQPFVLLRLLWRSRQEPGYRRRLGERFGRTTRPAPGGQVIWLHAVSVGETQAAAPLVDALLRAHPDYRVLLTTTTPSGSERAQALFGDRVLHSYAPWDLPGSVKRFLRRAQPRLLVLMETELWPNTLHYCRQAGCPVVVANARLSERSARGYARFPTLTREMLVSLARVGCQTERDGQRFSALGLPARALRVCGSLKYEITYSARQREQAKALRPLYRADSRPILVAASTHPGEEDIILDAFVELRARSDACLLLLFPRHPQRAAGVAALCGRRGFSVQRLSAGAVPDADTDIVLGDTIGDLAVLQSLASAVLVGGSLVPHGGHNPLEAAAWGVPLVCGPHMENFEGITQQLVAAGAMLQTGPGELTLSLSKLLADSPGREVMAVAALQVVEANRGALGRLLQLIDDQLARERAA